MTKEQAYRRGHYRLPVEHAPYHTAPAWYWVKMIDAVGYWSVPINGEED